MSKALQLWTALRRKGRSVKSRGRNSHDNSSFFFTASDAAFEIVIIEV